MKTLQELYREIKTNEELKKSFIDATKQNKQLEFIKEHGVEITADELNNFLNEKATKNQKLSVDELDEVAGGGCTGNNEVVNNSETSYTPICS